MSQDVQLVDAESPTRDLRHAVSPAKQLKARGNQRPQGYRPRHAAQEWDDTFVIDRVPASHRLGEETAVMPPMKRTEALLPLVSRSPGAALAAPAPAPLSQLSRTQRLLAAVLNAIPGRRGAK